MFQLEVTLFLNVKKYSVTVTAALVGYAGFINVISTLLPRSPFRIHLLDKIIPLETQFSSRSFTALAGFILIYVAFQLLRRKRLAWFVSIVLLVVASVFHLIKGLDIEETLINLSLVLLLYLTRNDYYAKNDPVTFRSGLKLMLYTFIFLIIFASIGLLIVHYRFNPRYSLGENFREIFNLITGQSDEYSHLSPRINSFFLSIRLISLSGFLWSFFLFFKPLLLYTSPSAFEREEVRKHVNQYGDTGVSYYAVMNDKHYFFNTKRNCVIAYGLSGNVAVTCGDPIGEPIQKKKTLRRFIEYCSRNGWTPSFYQISKQSKDYLRNLGFDDFAVGQEALIDLSSFTLSGKSKNDLRTALNKAESQKWVFIQTKNLDDPYLLQQCDEISEVWLKNKFGGELSFSMSGTTVRGDGQTITSIALDENRKVLSFATWVPMGGKKGLALDLMRRNVDVPNGIMEFIISKSVIEFKKQEFHWISLGLSPFAFSENADDKAQFAKTVVLLINRFYNTKGLFQFKDKFAPVWETRYFSFPNKLLLPKVL